MAKAVINTGESAHAVHTRTTADATETQAVVLAIDGSDAVVPVDASTGLRVSNLPAATGTAAWTSATAVNSAVTVAIAGYASVIVTTEVTGSVTAGVETWEASDDGGTTWWPAAAVRMGAASGFTDATTYAFTSGRNFHALNLPGMTHFRVRLSTVITGTGTVTPRVLATAQTLPLLDRIGGVALISNASDAITANQSTLGTMAAQAAFNGATFDRLRVANVVKNRTSASITAGTVQAIWTPTTGKKFRVIRGALSMSVAGSVLLKDAAVEILRSPLLAAAGVWSFDLGTNGIISTTANNVLNLDVSATGAVGGWVQGTEE